MAAGAPSKYDSKYNRQVFKLALLGAKDKEIADFLEISEATLNNWKIKYPELLESLKRGKIEADTRVVKSLYKRALGFKFNEVTFEDILETVVDHEGHLDHIPKTRIKTVKKFIIPDTTAQIFWLKNRQSAQWRDKQEIEHSLQEEQVFKIAGQTIKF